MIVRERVRPAALGFWSAAAASAFVVAAALLLDPRVTRSQQRLCLLAIAVAIIPAIRLAGLRPHALRLVDAAAAAGFTAFAFATFSVGGLAFLIPAFFMVLALANDRPVPAESAGSSRSLARWVLAVSAALLVLSLFDPGGAVFVVAPIALVLIAWAVGSRRRPKPL